MDWLQVLTAGGAVTAAGGAMATYIKTRPAMKTVELQGEGALWARISALEAKVDEANSARLRAEEDCERRLNVLETNHDKTRDAYEAKLTDIRHERNNLKQMLQMICVLAEEAPDSVVPRLLKMKAVLDGHA